MANSGKIILVEEDKDDIELISGILSESFPNHELAVYPKLERVFEYLNDGYDKPFIIMCDTNWRNKNQDRFADLSNKYPALKLKSVPFIFFSASPQTEHINAAFKDLNIQGYFQKRTSYEELKYDLNTIITYWERSIMPITE